MSARITDRLAIIRGVADGTLPSPYRAGSGRNFVAVRVSGTGKIRRPKYRETVTRDPALWLCDDMRSRVIGTAIIWDHLENDAVLDSQSFAQRCIGAVVHSFIKDGELWGVAAVDDATADAIAAGEIIDSSPGCLFPAFRADSDDAIEPAPVLIDHLALLAAKGAWSREGAPSGITRTNTLSRMDDMDTMRTDDSAAHGEKLDRLLSQLDGFGKQFSSICDRLEALEADSKEKKDAEEHARAAARQPEEIDDEGEEDIEELYTPEERQKRERGEAVPLAADEMKRRRVDAVYSAQARCDAVAAQFGQQAPPPLAGEGLRRYRLRALRQFQRYSPTWKSVDLTKVMDRSTLKIAEDAIYADAAAEAARPSDFGPTGLRGVTKKLASGHAVTEFFGRPDAWMGQFAGPVRRNVTRIKVPGQAA